MASETGPRPDTESGWYQPRKTGKFKLPSPLRCHRCEISVYQAEKVGPVSGVVFHLACFNCCVCSSHLTMHNYKSNPNVATDKEIYCAGHVPKIIAKSVKRDSIDIIHAVDAQQLRSFLEDRQPTQEVTSL